MRMQNYKLTVGLIWVALTCNVYCEISPKMSNNEGAEQEIRKRQGIYSQRLQYPYQYQLEPRNQFTNDKVFNQHKSSNDCK